MKTKSSMPQTIRGGRLPISLFACLPLALGLLGGCIHPSAILVSFDIDLAVSSKSPTGATWTAKADEIVRLPPSPKALDPFNGAIFRGQKFEAKFAAAKGAFEITVINLSAIETCFRFDKAHVSSNYRTHPLPLRGFKPTDWRQLHRQTKEDIERIRAAGPQVVEKACLGPGEQKRIPFYLTTKDYFPSGMMFNVAHPQHVAKLDPNGVGNWMKLDLPVESAGQSDVFEFKMIAMHSHARTTYY